MKLTVTLFIGLALWCATPRASAQASTQSSSAQPPQINVTINSPLADLATGFATAAGVMVEGRIVIYYRSEGQIISLTGIRSVQAHGGVLLVTFSLGDTVAIGADTVVLVTDGARKP